MGVLEMLGLQQKQPVGEEEMMGWLSRSVVVFQSGEAVEKKSDSAIGELHRLRKSLAEESERYARKKKELEQDISGKQDDVVAYAKRLKYEDRETIARMEASVRRLEKISRSGVERKVLEVFTRVFKGMRSLTVVLVPKGKDANGVDHPAITVGEFGFGIRQHMKSQRIGYYGEVQHVLQQKDAVLAGLRGLKMFAWAEKFEFFIVNAPDARVLNEGRVVVPLSSKVRVDVGDAVEREYYALALASGRGSGIRYLQALYAGTRRWDSTSQELSEEVLCDDWKAGLSFVMLRGELVRAAGLFDVEVSRLESSLGSWEQRMHEKFGMVLMMGDV